MLKLFSLYFVLAALICTTLYDLCMLGVIKSPSYQAAILLLVHIEGAASRSQKESIP